MSSAPTPHVDPFTELDRQRSQRQQFREAIEDMAADLRSHLAHRPSLAQWSATSPSDLEEWGTACWSAGRALAAAAASALPATARASGRYSPDVISSVERRTAGMAACDLLTAAASGDRAGFIRVMGQLFAEEDVVAELPGEVFALCKYLDWLILKPHIARLADAYRTWSVQKGSDTATLRTWAGPDRLSPEAELLFPVLGDRQRQEDGFPWEKLAQYRPPRPVEDSDDRVSDERANRSMRLARSEDGGCESVTTPSDETPVERDHAVAEYLTELGRRTAPVQFAFRRAAAATPGAVSEPRKVTVPLTTDEAFDALGAALRFHALNNRDIESNRLLIADGVFPPPGWNRSRWRALAEAVGANPDGADTDTGRRRIVEAAMACVNRRRLDRFGLGDTSTEGRSNTAVETATSLGDGKEAERESPPADEKDGPFGENRFRFCGVEVPFGRARLQYRLVNALWDKRNGRPALPRPVQDVINEIWGDDNNTTDEAFRQLCCDTRRRLEKHHCPITIPDQNGSGHVQLTRV